MTEVSKKKFWMVWSPDGRTPTHRHPSRQSATAEAERLAKANEHMNGFYVLEACDLVQLQRRPTQIIALIDEPLTEAELLIQNDHIPF